MPDKPQKPDWVPDNAGKEFTTSVMAGVEGGHDGMPGQPSGSVTAGQPTRPRRRRLSVDEYVAGVLEGNRNVLGQTITLVESNATAHMETAQQVIK